MGAITSLGSQNPQLPHWVLLQTDEAGIHLFASDRDGARRGLLLEAAAKTYRAALHRSIGQIVLMIFVLDQPPISLKGRWGPVARKPIRVAREVIALAKKS
jgi:hypothetical protein